MFLRGGIGVLIIAIALVIFFVVRGSIPTAVDGPLNMISDGIVIGKGNKAVPTAALTKDEKPVATVRDKKTSVVSIRMYVDYFCPVCESFESTNRTQLSSWLKSGAITLEIHPIALFDRNSLGTAYATRAANAGACVANYSPDSYWEFTQRIFAKQPAQNTAGLTNAQIVDVIRSSGADNLASIRRCVNSERFKTWVSESTDRAIAGPLPDSSVKSVTEAPVVIVDGQEYPITSADVASADAFTSFVEQTAGSQFDSGSSPSPTPTPTLTPAG